MSTVFGANTHRVLQFLIHIQDLDAQQVGVVARAWRRTPSWPRAAAWAAIRRTTTDQERIEVLDAASIGRRIALDTARRLQQQDWAFWAAVCDAAAAIAASHRIGDVHYRTLVDPLLEVMPLLAHPQRDQLRGRWPQEAVLKGSGA